MERCPVDTKDQSMVISPENKELSVDTAPIFKSLQG